MYRDDNEALLAQCDALRAELAAAAGDAEREKVVRAELEAKVAQLEAAGISEARREAAERGVRARGVFIGVAAGLFAAAAVVLAAFRILGAAAEIDAPDRNADPARAWFTDIRPRCNAVEIGVALDHAPPPEGATGYLATCYALAHKVDRAAAVIDAVADPRARVRAVDQMFQIIHPVADAGDDVAAGPVMELVVAHTPRNYMALFHAGMAAHETNRQEAARDYLERFLAIYKRADGWTARARRALAEIEAARPTVP